MPSERIPIGVTGLWLRNSGDYVEMLFECDGSWYIACREFTGGAFSHIVEVAGMRRWEHDPITHKPKTSAKAG